MYECRELWDKDLPADLEIAAQRVSPIATQELHVLALEKKTLDSLPRGHPQMTDAPLHDASLREEGDDGGVVV